jgi:hypothetical protein
VNARPNKLGLVTLQGQTTTQQTTTHTHMANKKVSAERTAELVALLQIPATVKYYPWFDLSGRGNIMFDIGSATKAWKKTDYEVSTRLFSVINSNCQSEHEVDALLHAIRSLDSPDMD